MCFSTGITSAGYLVTSVLPSHYTEQFPLSLLQEACFSLTVIRVPLGPTSSFPAIGDKYSSTPYLPSLCCATRSTEYCTYTKKVRRSKHSQCHAANPYKEPSSRVQPLGAMMSIGTISTRNAVRSLEQKCDTTAHTMVITSTNASSPWSWAKIPPSLVSSAPSRFH